MKKLTVLALCMAAAISMTACGQGQSSATTTSSKQTASQTESKQAESKPTESEKVESSLDNLKDKESGSTHVTSEGTNESEDILESSETSERVTIDGGWEMADSPKVPDEINKKLEKAQEALDGADYEAIAYLGSQVVAGTNYKLLCRITPVVPDAKDYFAIVTLYESLDGDVSFKEVLHSEKETGFNGLPGGWQKSETQEMTEEAKAALQKAVSEMVGAEYDPLALVATQVVSGTNYCILCEITPVVPDAVSNYGLVYVYEDLEGSAKITEIVDFPEGEIME